MQTTLSKMLCHQNCHWSLYTKKTLNVRAIKKIFEPTDTLQLGNNKQIYFGKCSTVHLAAGQPDKLNKQSMIEGDIL